MSKKDVQVLLDGLCIDLGLCLPLAEQSKLVEAPPGSALEFTEAVIVAEGLELDTVPRALYRQIRDMVERAFDA